MVDILLAFDNEDSHLGDFFNECSEDLLSYFDSATTAVNILKSPNLNFVDIEAATGNLDKFLFLAYSHGSENELLANGIAPFIDAANACNFSNSFFYTCSCHTGKALANVLIDEGCLSYIGYNNQFGVWDFNRQPFVNCANFGIKLFFEGIDSKEVLIRMKENYNLFIDNYANDIFGAAILLSNRKALRHHGNNIKLQDIAT